MLHSWNQLCFKEGVLEVSVSFAGPSGFTLLWPDVWTMGNLGRPGYRATTDRVWLYTYNSCDAGISPNQSSPDGLAFHHAQRYSPALAKAKTTRVQEQGEERLRSMLEGSVDAKIKIGVVTQSFQIAPFDKPY